MHHRVEAAFADSGPTGRLIGWLGVADELDNHIESGAAGDPSYFEWYARRPSFTRVGLSGPMIERQWAAIQRERELTLGVFRR